MRTLFYFFFSTTLLYSQKDSSKDFSATLFNVSYTVATPAADLAQRFGLTMGIQTTFENVSLKSGFIYGIDGFYFFGNHVKEDVLARFRTPDGNLLSDIGAYASVLLSERGYYAGVHAGKIFKLRDDGNHFNGLRCTFGIGFIQHSIRIDDPENSFVQIQPPYNVGYDRLTNGIAFNQFIAYQVVSRDKKSNFFIGADITEGITKNRRAYNFDTQQADTRTRFDLLLDLRLGWSFVLSTQRKAEDIEY